MQVYPTIEIQNGRCVSLHRGRLEEPTVWPGDPLAKAQAFAQAGAPWIHVTDLDAVAGGGGVNNPLLKRILRGTSAAIQLAGGFRDFDMIAEWIDLGAARIVVSTLALTQPHVVHTAARRFPDQIVLGVDVWDGHVMSHGWRNSSAYRPQEFIDTFADDPLAAIIVTDIAADIGETERPLALIAQIARHARTPVIARGLSRSIDDLSRLKYIGGIEGALVGRALFEGTIDLDQALALAAEPAEKRAEFI